MDMSPWTPLMSLAHLILEEGQNIKHKFMHRKVLIWSLIL